MKNDNKEIAISKISNDETHYLGRKICIYKQ